MHLNLCIVDELDFMICKKYVLGKLGNTYPDFFQHLGLTSQEIQVAQIDNNQNADGAMQVLWER